MELTRQPVHMERFCTARSFDRKAADAVTHTTAIYPHRTEELMIGNAAKTGIGHLAQVRRGVLFDCSDHFFECQKASSGLIPGRLTPTRDEAWATCSKADLRATVNVPSSPGRTS